MRSYFDVYNKQMRFYKEKSSFEPNIGIKETNESLIGVFLGTCSLAAYVWLVWSTLFHE